MSTKLCSWREKNGVIYLPPFITDGTTGPDWIKRLEDNGFLVGSSAKQVLCSPSFKPTSGVTIEVAVLKDIFFEDNDPSTKKIRAEADKLNFLTPNAELACLIRLKFTNKEIEATGLWSIVAMHEPINDSDGNPFLLFADRSVGGRCLYAYSGMPDFRWNSGYGYAFAVSQNKSE